MNVPLIKTNRLSERIYISFTQKWFVQFSVVMGG